MIQPGRKYSATDSYRYGFNGKENDDEVKGEGMQQDYGMRIYDPRLGKFLSVDPLTRGYPELTPYQFASNSPIIYIDIDGAEGGLGGFFLPNIFTPENTDQVKAKLGVKKGSFWDGAINFISGGASRVHQLNDPRTYANAAVQNSQPAKIIKTFTAPTEEERLIAGASIFLPSIDAAIGYGELTKKTVNGDMRSAGTLTVDVAYNLSMASTTKPWVPYRGKLIIGTKTFARIAKHLERFEVDAGNAVMMDRMKKIVEGKLKPTEIDINFAKHELRESELMKKGKKYEEAHKQTLEEQGMSNMNVSEYEKKLYTQEALDASKAQWEKQIKNK